MADDLASFIESQKRKLEKERAEILQGQKGEDRSRTSPRGNLPDKRHFQEAPAPVLERTRAKVKGIADDDSSGGLKLGGYEKHQEKLRQERKEEYRKYLAEKNFRSTGKVEPVLSENSQSSTAGHKPNEHYEYCQCNNPFRSLRLNARQYKEASRSDGYLSRRYNDDYDDWSHSRSRPSGQKERSFESKRVHFHDEDDLDNGSWVMPRRRLDYFDDDEDEDKLQESARKKGKRSQRRNSAHLPERDLPKDETLQRSKTDSSIRSQSAPLESTGLLGVLGSEESKSVQAKKKEQYRRDLQQQMQEQADNKKRERMLRLGVEQESSGRPLNSQFDRTPPGAASGLYGQSQAQGYDMSLANHGPRTRPPSHPAVHPNPYDDPYYSYGGLESGTSQGLSLDAPRGTTQGNRVPGARLDAGATGGGPDPFSRHAGKDLSPHSGFQPPGGFSSITTGEHDTASIEKKKAAQQAYQEELKKQMVERNARKEIAKQEKERYERRIEQQAANYNPWGKGGGGAPIRDSTGHLVANLRTLKQMNDQGVNMSPRDQPPSVETRFEATNDSFQSPRTSAVTEASPMMQAAGQIAGRTGFGRSDPLKEAQPQDDLKKAAKLEYQEYLRKQVEEKEKKKKEELEKIKKEEEDLEKKITEDRLRMQRDFEIEQEKNRKKEEEARLKNEQLKEEQEAKKREAEKKKKEMEEQRQAELKRKLDAELAAKKASGNNEGVSHQARANSPPIPTVLKKMEAAGQDTTDFRTASPPIPTVAKKGNAQGSNASPTLSPPVALGNHLQQEPVRNTELDHDVLSQLTALRQQLKNEEKRVQQQMDHTSAVTKYSDARRVQQGLGSRRGKRDVDVFRRALSNKTAVVKKDSEGFSAADEFNRIKSEDTSSLAGEFRSKFPDPASTNSVLDLQQQAYLIEQEDKLAELRSDGDRDKKQSLQDGQTFQVSRRPGSSHSLLESESQFLSVDDPKQMLSLEQMSSRPRQSSARERRRWKQLEEMAKNPKPSDTHKPPTPGGFSLNSVTSFNVDEVATRNEERLQRLEMIQRVSDRDGRGSLSGDPDKVLQRFMEQRGRPSPVGSRNSEASIEAETSFQPI
ncbi:PREDICTED: centrosome and spindle pole associated protein 1-like [Acropora digitifera]|uniref:centrosome and spindle pole associated protein 1-like n=1 Tax=Acropora digitifera TaxID=70779 RepID=UPI00077A6AE3|nr:PREDICTED: centrosome and spindle pole associated protein 1-like [Acropora digitifera]